uniref:Uncharacterized protein n=1 Tax=Hyaloperonospora arabidopsidis (strain Emoy2) TaxID=559515 RepID=M4BSP6_HYAAE
MYDDFDHYRTEYIKSLAYLNIPHLLTHSSQYMLNYAVSLRVFCRGRAVLAATSCGRRRYNVVVTGVVVAATAVAVSVVISSDCIRQHLACDSLTVISGATPPAAVFDVLQNYFSYTYNVTGCLHYMIIYIR